MKITAFETGSLSVKLKKTFKTALRTLDCTDSPILFIKTDTEHVGIGAAAPTEVITGETRESIVGAFRHMETFLVGKDICRSEEIFRTLNSCLIGNTSAKAAVDMAIHDLLGKRLDLPLYQLLGGYRSELETNLTISLDTPEKMAEEAKKAVARGFRILKIKVGNDVDLDFERLKTVRQTVGDSVKIRVDANQGWTRKEAIAAIDRLEAENIRLELVEQPVQRDDTEGLGFITRSSRVPIIADESVFTPVDVLKLIKLDAVDGINIKLMKCGGIYNALKMVGIAETAGLSCMIGSMMESPVSVTAAAHLAFAKAAITQFDLDAPLFCAKNPVKGGLIYQNSIVELPDTPGLGIEKILDISYH